MSLISILIVSSVIALLGLFVWLKRKASSLFKDVNLMHGLSLDCEHIIGLPGVNLIAFDSTNKKIALLDLVSKETSIVDFSYIRSWNYEYKDVLKKDITGYGHVSERVNFKLILDVSDVNRPRREFPMSEKNAIEWCSRLGAIYGV